MSQAGPTLVTGATGFVGSAVARALLARGHALRLLVRAGSDRANVDGLPAECVEGLNIDNIDWDDSIFDASTAMPVAATATVQQLHAGPATLWVPKGSFARHFGIDDATFGRWNRR